MKKLIQRMEKRKKEIKIEKKNNDWVTRFKMAE